MDLSCDSDYAFFLQNLVPHGKAYAFKMPIEGSSALLLIKYEEKADQSDALNPRRKRIRSGEGPIVPVVLEVKPLKSVLSQPSSFGSDGTPYEPDYFEFLQTSGVLNRHIAVPVEKEVLSTCKEEIEKDVPKIEFSDRESSVIESVIAQIVDEVATSNEVTEESVNSVLDKSKNTNLGEKQREKKFHVKKDQSIAKEIEAQSASIKKDSSENFEKERVNEAKKSKSQASRHVAANDWIEEIKEPIYEIPMEILNKPSSEYKDRLIKYISKPFDNNEYRLLMKNASIRTQKLICKETRKGVRFCETDELSKSYFDYHPDFAEEVEKAERGRQWILLRGFFFWLQNVSCEGVFMPWKKW